MCGNTSTKYLLFFFNFVFCVIGIVLLALGVWAHLDPEFVQKVVAVSGDGSFADSAEDMSVYIKYMSIFVMVLGGIVTVIGFFGCFGAIQQSKCCLGVFFVLLLLCFLVTLFLGGFLMFIAATGDSDDPVSEDIRDAFVESVKYVWQLLTDEQRQDFERANHCCGIKSDFISRISNYKCSIFSTEDCFDKLVSNIQAKFWIAGGVVLGIALVELIGMIMACALFNAVSVNRSPHYRAV